MTKYFCDLCGKELQRGHWTKLQWTARGVDIHGSVQGTIAGCFDCCDRLLGGRIGEAMAEKEKHIPKYDTFPGV